MPLFHPASACLPGIPLAPCIERLHAGIAEPMLGTLDCAHIQLCPQTPGHLDEGTCEALAASFPVTQFRLHANARVHERLRLLDASTLSATTLPYYRALADRSRRLGATAYSLHAGYREHATLDRMIDNVRRLQDLFGFPVAVEGLYPRADRPQLMDGWADYEVVLDAGLPIALDLSHLNIVRATDAGGAHEDLVGALLAHPLTIEVHVSSNNGTRDDHRTLTHAPWWWSAIDRIHSNATVFSEGNQLAPFSSPNSTHPGARHAR